jgi:hypothetical protein
MHVGGYHCGHFLGLVIGQLAAIAQRNVLWFVLQVYTALEYASRMTQGVTIVAAAFQAGATFAQLVALQAGGATFAQLWLVRVPYR